MKSLIKSLLPPIIFDGYKKIKEKKIVYYSLNDLDKKIENYLDINTLSGQYYLFKNNIEKTP
jgi:hypothetical protein